MLKKKDEFLDLTRFKFIAKGFIVGIIVGFVVSLFRFIIEFALHYVLTAYHFMRSHPIYLFPWLLLMLLIALINSRLIKKDPNIMGSGIPQVEGQLAGEMEMNWWSVLWRKWIGGVLSIASGLFLGREGPSIQLGAAVGQGIAEKTHHRGAGKRVLIAGGAAAGLSAAFNAPIASSLFVLEEVYHNFSPLIWTTALSSAIASDFISMNFFGLTPVLHLHYFESFPIKYYFLLIFLGVFLGFLGKLYSYMTLNIDKVYAKIKCLSRNLDSIIPLLLVIPLGLFWPQVLGGGNSVVLGISNFWSSTWLLILLFVVRLVFSTISYGSGLPGGIFLPILTLGAIFGALFGKICADLGLMPKCLIINCVIYAMAGYFACIGKAPFTAILLITEMVGSLSHLMPLALVSLISYTVVDIMRGRPIYEAMLDALLPEPEEQAQTSTFQDRIEVPVFAGSFLQDTQVRDFKWPKECLLIAIRRGERELIPHGDTVIRSGDTLVILTSHENRAWIRHRIEEIAKEVEKKKQLEKSDNE
ncbi:chloride channel protein [Ligilactobacillus sp. LYQ135]